MDNLEFNEAIAYYISQGFSPEKAESIANVYIDFVENEGFEDSDELKEFAIEVERKYTNQTARPKDFVKNNKTSHRQGKSIANETIKKYKEEELCINTPEFVEKTKEKFVSVKDTPEETSFNHVKSQLKYSIEQKLRNPEVENNIIQAINKHKNYRYTDLEVKQFANQIIKHVSERESEYIATKLSLEMNSDDMYKEQKTIKNTITNIFLNERNFWKGLGNGIGEKIYKYLSKEGIQIIGLIIGGVITGASSLGLI